MADVDAVRAAGDDAQLAVRDRLVGAAAGALVQHGLVGDDDLTVRGEERRDEVVEEESLSAVSWAVIFAANDLCSGPSGLSDVVSRYGVTADARAMLCTRSEPCRDRYRTTSPPPIEKPTRVTSVSPSCSRRAARSSLNVS
jgi:hypothetical protein